jgi:hypothetical protein
VAEKFPNDPLPPDDAGSRKPDQGPLPEEPLELFDFIEESELPQAVPVEAEEPLELLEFFEDDSAAEPPMAEPVELVDFLDEAPPAPAAEKTDPSAPAIIPDHTWAEIALDDVPPEENAEKTDFLDLDSDIFAAERTEVELPASAVNLIHPNVEPTLKSDDEDDSDANVTIGVAPPNESDEPLTAARLYASHGDSDVQPIPMAEPVEFGAGAEEIDFDILRTNESSSALYPTGPSAAGASGVQLGEPPSAVDSASSIFGEDSGLRPTSPGSGWFDPPRSAQFSLPPQEPPPSSKTSIGEPEAPRSGGSIADLFGMLARGPATPSVSVSSGWVQEDKTGNITESEVLKAFDQLANPTAKFQEGQLPASPTSDALGAPLQSGESGPDFNKVDLEGEGSHLFPQPQGSGRDLFDGPSGVDILEAAGLMDTGGSQSSIFSQAPRAGDAIGTEPTEQVGFEEGEVDFDHRTDALFGGSGIHGSSIFEKGVPRPEPREDDATQADLPELDDLGLSAGELASHDAIEAGLDWGEPAEAPAPVEAGVDWDIPENREPNDQVSMYMPKPDSLSDIDDLFHPAGPVSPVKAEQELLASDSASQFVEVVGSKSAADSGIIHGPASGGYASGPVSGVIRAAQLAEDEDEPVALATPKNPKRKKDEAPAKRKGSLGGWIGGGVAGVLLGAGGVGGAYMAGLLPAVEGSKSVAPVAKVDPRMDQELKAAVAKLAETEKKAAEEAEVMSAKLRESGEQFNKLKDDLDDAKAAAAKAQTDLKTAMAAATKAQDELKTALTDSEKAKDDAKLAKADAEKAAKDLVDAKKSLTEAETLAADTEKKRKAADDALAVVVKELKAAKLIPDDDEPAAALAKLPDVFKNAAIAMTSADAKKAAEAIAMASKQIDALKQAMAKAEESLTTAKAETKEAMAAAEKAKADAAKMLADAKKEADDKQTAAVAKAESELKKQVETANKAAMFLADKLKAEQSAQAAKLTALNEEHAKQLLEARAGAGIELTTAEARALDRSFASYGRGVNAYHNRKFAEAETALKEATADFQSDARYWYFLGLAQFQQGKNADAEASFKKGAELEKKNLPGRAVINEELQRIQGTLRLELAKYRP